MWLFLTLVAGSDAPPAFLARPGRMCGLDEPSAIVLFFVAFRAEAIDDCTSSVTFVAKRGNGVSIYEIILLAEPTTGVE